MAATNKLAEWAVSVVMDQQRLLKQLSAVVPNLEKWGERAGGAAAKGFHRGFSGNIKETLDTLAAAVDKATGKLNAHGQKIVDQLRRVQAQAEKAAASVKAIGVVPATGKAGGGKTAKANPVAENYQKMVASVASMLGRGADKMFPATKLNASEKAMQAKFDSMTKMGLKAAEKLGALGRQAVKTDAIMAESWRNVTSRFSEASRQAAKLTANLREMAAAARGMPRAVPQSRTSNAPQQGQQGGGGIAAAVFKGNIYTKLAEGAANLAMAPIGWMQDFVAETIDANAEIEKLTTSMKVMLGGSQEAADWLIADIRKMAAVTPFDTAGLARASQSLIGVGVDAREVLGILTKLGDAAAASTEGMEALPRIVRAISQMKSKGKVQAEDMMQISELGIPGWQLLAKEMGKSTEEVQALSKAGKLGMREVDQLIDGLGNKFKGMMGEQAKTWSGLWSTIGDNTRTLVADVGKPLFDVAKEWATNIVAMFDNSAFKQGAALIRENIASMASGVSSFASSMMSSLGPTFAAMTDWARSLQATFTAWLSIGEQVLDYFFGLRTVVGGVQSAWSGLAAVGPGWFTEALKSVQALSEGLAKQIIPLMNDLGTWVRSLVRGFADWVSGIGKAISEFLGLKTIIVGLRGEWQAFSAIAPTAITDGFKEIRKFAQGLATDFKQLAPVLVTGFDAMYAGVKLIMEKIKALIVSTFMQAVAATADNMANSPMASSMLAWMSGINAKDLKEGARLLREDAEAIGSRGVNEELVGTEGYIREGFDPSTLTAQRAWDESWKSYLNQLNEVKKNAPQGEFAAGAKEFTKGVGMFSDFARDFKANSALKALADKDKPLPPLSERLGAAARNMLSPFESAGGSLGGVGDTFGKWATSLLPPVDKKAAEDNRMNKWLDKMMGKKEKPNSKVDFMAMAGGGVFGTLAGGLLGLAANGGDAINGALKEGQKKLPESQRVGLAEMNSVIQSALFNKEAATQQKIAKSGEDTLKALTAIKDDGMKLAKSTLAELAKGFGIGSGGQ